MSLAQARHRELELLTVVFLILFVGILMTAARALDLQISAKSYFEEVKVVGEQYTMPPRSIRQPAAMKCRPRQIQVHAASGVRLVRAGLGVSGMTSAMTSAMTSGTTSETTSEKSTNLPTCAGPSQAVSVK